MSACSALSAQSSSHGSPASVSEDRTLVSEYFAFRNAESCDVLAYELFPRSSWSPRSSALVDDSRARVVLGIVGIVRLS